MLYKEVFTFKYGKNIVKVKNYHKPLCYVYSFKVSIENDSTEEKSHQSTVSSTTDIDGEEGRLFYIPLPAGVQAQPLIQGVTVKLGTEGPQNKLVMSAKLVTKPPASTIPVRYVYIFIINQFICKYNICIVPYHRNLKGKLSHCVHLRSPIAQPLLALCSQLHELFSPPSAYLLHQNKCYH